MPAKPFKHQRDLLESNQYYMRSRILQHTHKKKSAEYVDWSTNLKHSRKVFCAVASRCCKTISGLFGIAVCGQFSKGNRRELLNPMVYIFCYCFGWWVFQFCALRFLYFISFAGASSLLPSLSTTTSIRCCCWPQQLEIVAKKML